MVATTADGIAGEVKRLRELRGAVSLQAGSIADRLVCEHGTVMAEYILSEAMRKVCGVNDDVAAISQIWVLADDGPGEYLNTSALAEVAANARGR